MSEGVKTIFFSGINGIGMSGLAKIMVTKGYNVYGSDIVEKPISKQLRDMGVGMFIGQEAENLAGKDIDLFIYSSAIKESNPEYKYAVDNNIRKIKRGELLALLMNDSKGIAVAGTHGKTTTSSMLGITMLEKDPCIVVGGIIPEIGSNSKVGNSEYFIAEADESDNSFLYLTPSYSIVTNVEADHLENHGSYENIKKSFEEFIDKTSDIVILNKDCHEIEKLNLKNKNIIWYSINNESADIYAKNIEYKNRESHYEVVKNGESLGLFRLSIPGEHNISNSLGVIFLAHEFSCDMDKVKEYLYNFRGANRRYQILYDKTIKIIDDYAHHPTEITATINAAKKIETEKIVVVFQPHRYSRTNFFLNEFAESLKLADEVYLLPIYSAEEENIYNISSEKLAELVGKNTKVYSEEEITGHVMNDKSDNVYLFMGAGSISRIANTIKNKLIEG
ncbi:UDP-N-acetylmuramate--L-alanine ligase [Sebaldella sp. S0638]|uniref:UDP-N-acetylmuramate--L-alanine ligase n=1 Tax=Sebaldella sp. S0638 TaxID=2957809 RepID=UPI00209D5696|nr:UDP-N-acetylmuramate--L-alanine ligase [Sebaldella sp. S0638]MCP1223942.1 UDP-N-acetylmuramate--L-alanine ligase [Sebaldella sp. S0638]